MALLNIVKQLAKMVVVPDGHLPAAGKGTVRDNSGAACQAAQHPDAHRAAAAQGRGLCPACRWPQPPGGQAIHRAMRGRCAEVKTCFPNLISKTGHQSIRRCSGVPFFLSYFSLSPARRCTRSPVLRPWGWLPPARSCGRGTARQRPWRTLRSLRQNR